MDSPLRMDAAEAKRRIREFDVILDVRTDLEVQTLGAYPKSVHIPSSELKSQLPSKIPNKSAKVLAYCNSGQRARAAAETMKELGYSNVR